MRLSTTWEFTLILNYSWSATWTSSAKSATLICDVWERFAGRWRRNPCWRSCTPSSQAESIIVTVSSTGRMDIFSTDFNLSWTRLRGWSWVFPPPSAMNFTGCRSGNASCSKTLSSCDIVSDEHMETRFKELDNISTWAMLEQQARICSPKCTKTLPWSYAEFKQNSGGNTPDPV